MERVIHITGMGCARCEAKVRDALAAVAGVSKVVVSRVAEQAVVLHDGSVADEQLLAALSGLSYTVGDVRDGNFRPESILPGFPTSQILQIKENIHIRTCFLHSLNNQGHTISVLTGIGYKC